MDEEEPSSHVPCALAACPISLEHRVGYEERTIVRAILRLVAIDPRRAAALAHAEARRVLPLVRDHEEHVLAIGVAEVHARPVIPIELVAACDLGQLRG